QLRLTHGIQINVSPVIVENLQNRQAASERIGKVFWPDEVQIIRRSVVLGKFSMRRTRQASHRQIDTRRAILALVMPVRIKFTNLMVIPRLLGDVEARTVVFGIAPPALLVSKLTRVSQVDEDEPMFDSSDLILVAPKPSDRADGSGNED